MSKKIRFLSGAFEEGGQVDDKTGHLDKKVMMVYCGKFESMDGPVEIKDEDIEKLVSNHNKKMSQLSRMASGELPMKHSPPIQLDHSTSARDTVGRLVGELMVGQYQPEGGVALKAMYGTARFLGKENIEKVQDGRWSHVSMGADLDTHTLSELTVTPFPAAADASLLSARLGNPEDPISYKGHNYCARQTAGGGKWCAIVDGEPLPGDYADYRAAVKEAKSFIDENVKHDEANFSAKLKKLSKPEDKMGYKDMKEKMAAYAKCKSHLMDEKKMSEEDAEKHLESASDDDVKKMASEHDEHMKHMAEEDAKKKDEELKRMSGYKEHKTKLIALSKGMREQSGKIALAQKKLKISTRLGRLQAERKISPAEIKAMEIEKLSAKSDEVIDATLKAFEKREHIIDSGLIGSTKALSAGKLSSRLKKLNMERDELQTRLNMPSKRDEALKRLAKVDEEMASIEAVPAHVDVMPDKEDEAHFEQLWGHMKGLLDSGKHEEAKEHLKKHLANVVGPRMSDVGMPVGPDSDPHMSALADGMKKMQTEFDEIVKLTGPIFDIKPEELV